MTENNLPKKVFWKCLPIKIIVCVFWWFLAICFFTGATSAEYAPLMIILWCLCFIPIAQTFAKKLVIWDDHITIKSWLIFRKSEDIKYKKINNIEKSEAFWMWGLIFFTGNDKGTKFKNLEDYNIVQDYINEKIEEKS